jgi:hypothetical protein
MPSKKVTCVLIRCLTPALFLSTHSLLSSQSATANIPASARLIGNGQGSTSTILNTNGLSATELAQFAAAGREGKFQTSRQSIRLWVWQE